MKKPSKCPNCRSSRITINSKGDLCCQKCSWINLRKIPKITKLEKK